MVSRSAGLKARVAGWGGGGYWAKCGANNLSKLTVPLLMDAFGPHSLFFLARTEHRTLTRLKARRGVKLCDPAGYQLSRWGRGKGGGGGWLWGFFFLFSWAGISQSRGGGGGKENTARERQSPQKVREAARFKLTLTRPLWAKIDRKSVV